MLNPSWPGLLFNAVSAAEETSSTFTSRAIELEAVDLALAACLVITAGLVSFALRLGLERQLAIAALRTVTQLLLIGYILRYIFELETFWAVGGWMAVMIAAASITAVRRSSRTYRGAQVYAFAVLVLSGLLTSYAVTGVVIGVTPWYQPQYIIPLLGMILGNSLTGISLCLDVLLERLKEHRHVVEMELAHGATRWEAALPQLREAVRRGMIPIINSMMVVGVVSLPGMMTGQILAGADPLEAVKYQIVVMFMIGAATSVGCMFIAFITSHRLFNAKHQLRADAILSRR